MARKKPKQIRKGMQVVTQGAGMFGETVSQVLHVRPSSKRNDDEAVVLTYRRSAAGKRSRGNVEVIPLEEAAERFIPKK